MTRDRCRLCGIVELQAGELVPADGLVIDAHNIQINQAATTASCSLGPYFHPLQSRSRIPVDLAQRGELPVDAIVYSAGLRPQPLGGDAHGKLARGLRYFRPDPTRVHLARLAAPFERLALRAQKIEQAQRS